MWEKTKHGAIDVIVGDRPLTADNAGTLKQVLEQCVHDGQPRLVLDLRDVSLIDSIGLELLLDARDTCIKRGGTMQLASVSPLCLDILKVTGVAADFEIFSDSISAAGSFSQ